MIHDLRLEVCARNQSSYFLWKLNNQKKNIGYLAWNNKSNMYIEKLEIVKFVVNMLPIHVHYSKHYYINVIICTHMNTFIASIMYNA